MSEKWFYSIIHSCLRLYISLQKWHSTLEHLSLHLKPRGIRFLFLGGGGGGPAVERPEKENQVLCRFFFFYLFFSGHQQSSRQSATSSPRRAQIPRSPRLSAFERDNHVCQHMAPGVTRWITKDSDCCWAGSLTERSGRTATAAVAGDRWVSWRKIEGGRVWKIGPSEEDRAD